MNNLTAKMSCFARAYHRRNNIVPVFDDTIAEKLLGEEDYAAVENSLAQRAGYFLNGLESDGGEDALKRVVDCIIAPSVLGRSAFNERCLMNEIRLGASQYVIFGSGYDTYAYRAPQSSIKVFELDLPEAVRDKLRREERAGLKPAVERTMVPCDLSDPEWSDELEKNGFDSNIKSYGSLLGLSYYFDKREFAGLIKKISELFCTGSAVCFDYPMEHGGFGEDGRIGALARGVGEAMKSVYNEKGLEKLLSDCGFLVYMHLSADEMTGQYFDSYNKSSETYKLHAPSDVGYILAVRK